MKQLIQITFICLIITGFSFASCKQIAIKIVGCMDPTSSNYNPSATEDNGTCQYAGNITFWAKSNEPGTTVSVGGKTGSITSNFPTVDAACGSAGCANFTLPVGSYPYTATSTLSNWSGTVTVTKNGCSLVLLQPQIARIGTNYYVAKTGSDTNAGTLTAPYLTIQKGLGIAQAGDTVFVKAGTYQEYVSFKNSGTMGQPIVLKNYGNEVVLVDAENTRVYCIYTNKKSNLVVDGINAANSTVYNVFQTEGGNVTIKNINSSLPIVPGKSNYCFLFQSTTIWSHNITMQNCVAYGGGTGVYINDRTDGMKVTGGEVSYSNFTGFSVGTIGDTAIAPRNIVVDRVYSHNNGRSGIGTRIAKNVTFRNCHSSYNASTGIQIEAMTYNSLMEDNLCEYNSRSFGYETGIWIFNSDGAIVRRNIMRGNSTGLRVSKMKNFQAYYNLIMNNNYNLDGTNQNTSGVDFSESSGTFYNNTLIGNSASNSKLGSIYVYPLYPEGGVTQPSNITIKNNIIMNDGSVDSPKDMDFDQSVGSTVICDYNLVYNANRAINIQIGTTNYSWATYKLVSSQDSHSINSNPLFVNAGSEDYRLQAGSPAINAGVNVGLTTDYLGHTINGLPDIGAYEY